MLPRSHSSTLSCTAFLLKDGLSRFHRSDSLTTRRNQKNPNLGFFWFLERVTGIGPVSLAWEASVLPLYYTRLRRGYGKAMSALPYIRRSHANLTLPRTRDYRRLYLLFDRRYCSTGKVFVKKTLVGVNPPPIPFCAKEGGPGLQPDMIRIYPFQTENDMVSFPM